MTISKTQAAPPLRGVRINHHQLSPSWKEKRRAAYRFALKIQGAFGGTETKYRGRIIHRHSDANQVECCGVHPNGSVKSDPSLSGVGSDKVNVATLWDAIIVTDR